VRQATGWLTRRPDDLSKADTVTLHEITDRCPALAITYDLVREFAKILTRLRGDLLNAWLTPVDQDRESELRAFAASAVT
jgi:hypothetical protein